MKGTSGFGMGTGTGGISLSSLGSARACPENRLLTLLPVRCTIERVERPPMEERLACGGLRRKSVR